MNEQLFSTLPYKVADMSLAEFGYIFLIIFCLDITNFSRKISCRPSYLKIISSCKCVYIYYFSRKKYPFY